MNNKIKEILNDLYALDTTLCEHEDKIIKIIEEYIKAKPDTKFDEKFMLKLRKEIMEKAEAIGRENKILKKSFWVNLPFYYRYAYIAVGAVIVLSLLFVFPYILNINEVKKLAFAPSINLDKGILNLKEKAFGAIYTTSENQNFQERDASIPVGLGGGGLSLNVESTSKISMPAPQIINYNYIYKGEEFTIDNDEMAVYKKIKSEDAGKSLGNYISRLKFDIVDLSKFDKTTITNLNLVENKEYGYSLYFNFVDDILDINQDYNQWPHPERSCSSSECFDSYRLSIEDIPEDSKIISLANKFMRDYNIDISHYGEPSIQDSWRVYYERAKSKYDLGIPEEISVIYPLVIEGNIVRDEGGNPSGMSVSVNIRYNRVSGVRPITSYSFESSNYEVETDVNRILEFAKRGGVYPEYRELNSKEIDVELGTPTKDLVRHWVYDNKTGGSQELFVPALIFPIQNVTGFEEEDNYYYREYVTVPIVKEVMEKYNNSDVLRSPKIEPMIILEEASEESIIGRDDENNNEIENINILDE